MDSAYQDLDIHDYNLSNIFIDILSDKYYYWEKYPIVKKTLLSCLRKIVTGAFTQLLA